MTQGRLDGKVAIITGATSGIGEATARLFAAEGARVVLAGRRAELGEALAEECGAESHFIRCDVNEEEDIRRLIDETQDRFGRIDCLVNNAGAATAIGGITDLTAEDFDREVRLLQRSVFLGMRYVAPIMIAQKNGSIINTTSVAATRAGLSLHLYSMAKAAVLHLTRCVAMELGEHFVRVNAISPGAIATPVFLPEVERTAAAPEAMQAVKEALKGATPIPRSGLPEDVAACALYLASDESSFVNAQDILVDGGMTAGRRYSEYVGVRWAPDRDGSLTG